MDNPLTRLVTTPNRSVGPYTGQVSCGKLAQSYLESTEPDLHCTVVNWPDRRISTERDNFEALLGEGLRNVMAHGNSNMRTLASSSLSLVYGI